MNLGALFDWQMIFRKNRGETQQHLVLKTSREKTTFKMSNLKMKAGEKKNQLSENLEKVNLCTLSLSTLPLTSQGFSY